MQIATETVPIVARVAGGWVRDKMLHRPSLDIDITLDVVTGRQFVAMIANLIEQEKRSDVGFHVLPEASQSAHLQVATATLFGLEIDFNQLRKETYDPESRIPAVEIGTIQEDSDRRDFTINALYYNINTDAIEDFDGRGLSDLEAGIVRSFGNPTQRFMDDPLRLLRLARYAGRYCFQVEATTLAAARQSTIHEALQTKVSRERFGMELLKLFKADNAMACLLHLAELQLFGVLFDLPPVLLPDREANPFPFFPVPVYYLSLAEITPAALAVAECISQAMQKAVRGLFLFPSCLCPSTFVHKCARAVCSHCFCCLSVSNELF
ncbi:uncharacterized protein MONBRDRAFT_25981 [Monosiga brevicollis MX1]|uniref:Poly A polymerase head domain-containing protein n=1 Tax=Monosiga brevicollis TaxID=81824 RepID=A9V112_MONBE|nr:uncharacterized protein MONBRDRAFT_25981 [Monosiga brevicollis MX1]EDQ88852.1 predicted protein [Monosiga brevicollis MX1]|eukprot:XP_001746465.1 hypothetical protein [Monosiga brevicollis MX1]